MSNKSDKTIADIVQAVRESDEKKTKPYDTTATVTRVEDGKAWVHIPGGVAETPAELTINAKQGDSVMVRVAGGRAFLLGNATNPPTDDSTAETALANANDALHSAINARIAADSAEQSAEVAQASAETAETAAAQAVEDAATANANAQTAIADAAAAASAASQAQTSADSALSSAQSAQSSANGALKGLSTVQDVIGVLDWAKENATYTLTSDSDIVPGKTYWTRSGSGTEADPYTYTPVVTPVKADLGTYYEISGVDEAMADYINTHLALTDEGLYVLGGADQWKVLIAADGVYIIDGTSGYDKIIAKYSKTITLGEHNEGNTYIIIDNDSVDFYDGITRTATVGPISHFGEQKQGLGDVVISGLGLSFMTRNDGSIKPLPVKYQAGEIGIVTSNQGYEYRQYVNESFEENDSVVMEHDPLNDTDITLSFNSSGVSVKYTFPAGAEWKQRRLGGFRYDGYKTIYFDRSYSLLTYIKERSFNPQLYSYYVINPIVVDNPIIEDIDKYFIKRNEDYIQNDHDFIMATTYYTITYEYVQEPVESDLYKYYHMLKTTKSILLPGRLEYIQYRFYDGDDGTFLTIGTRDFYSLKHINTATIGIGLLSTNNNQLIIGRHNIGVDFPLIIGNGLNNSNKSNAFTVDWDGNTEMQGRATTADMSTAEITAFLNELRGVTS